MASVDSYILKLGIQGEGEVTAATRAMQALEDRTRSEMQALAALGGSLDAAKAKLAQMQAAASLQGGKSVNIGGILAQREKIAGLEAKQAQGGANVAKLQGALPSLKAKADVSEAKAAAEKLKAASEEGKGAAISFRKLGAAAGETDGPLGNFVRTIGKFKAAGTAGAILALIGVLIACATAAVVASIALTKFAIASADAARSSHLLAGAAAGSAAGGAELEAVIDDIALKSPLARDKIAEMGRAMEVAHLQGRNMQNALEAAATASSAIGDSAGAALTSIAENSQKARRFMLSRNDFTGVSAELEGTGVAFADVAKALADAQGMSIERAAQLIKSGQVAVKDGLEAMNAAVQAKFGKTVAAQMLSLNTQFQKMHEAFAKLFDGIDLEPFLKGLQMITGLFSQNTVTGVALKTLFQSIFNPLSESAATVFPVIEAFIQGMVIATLMMYLGFLKVKEAITEALGGDSASKIDWIKTAMWAGGIAVVAFVGAIAGLTIGIIVLAAVFLPLAILFSLPFLLAVASIAALVYALNWVATTLNDAIIGAWQGVVDYFKSNSLADIGLDMIRGLAAGIGSGASLVIAAVESLGKTAMTTLKGVLGIHSPSTVFHAYGMYTAQGFEQGVDAGTPAANDKVKTLGGGGAPAVATSPRGNARRGGGDTFNFYVTADDEPKIKRILFDILGTSADRSPEPEPAT